MLLSEWDFEGPFHETDALPKKPGVFVLIKVFQDEIDIVAVGVAEDSISLDVQSQDLWRTQTSNEPISVLAFSREEYSLEKLEEVKRKLVLEYLSR